MSMSDYCDFGAGDASKEASRRLPSRYKSVMSDDSAAAAPRSRGPLPNVARALAVLALLSFALPWLWAPFGVATSGLGFLTGAATPTRAPSIPLALALGATAITLLFALMMERARGAAVSMLGYAIALILFAIFALQAIFSWGITPGIGAWLFLASLVAAIVVDRMILPEDWRSVLPEGFVPYTEKAPLAAFFVGISSGFPYAMIGATLTTRLAQDDIDKSTVTAFALAFLVYNFKFAWAWIVDGVRIPLLGRLGQRVSWLIVAGLLVIAAVANLAVQDPSADIYGMAVAAILVGFAGATFDIVIDAYRIELLEPRQLGVGSGMSQYGWRIGAFLAGALALVLAARVGWELAYLACATFALPAMITGLVVGEPTRHRAPTERKGIGEAFAAIIGPFLEFFRRHGAWLVILFVLLHKIGDTLANLVLRLLLDDMGYTNDEIALWDVGIGFWAFLVGIFIGGVLYAQMGMKRSVLLALVLMGISNASFALLAMSGHTNLGLAATMTFENIASGFGGVVVVAYFSALTDLRFTAAQYALISAAASIVGRLLTGTTAGAMVEAVGFVNFYWFTTAAALPGILLFWWMMRAGLIDASVGTAGKVGEGDARADSPSAA
jgi:MFS transporter, PAT family, beta-lactamase induction signal transducer AmpG